MTPEDILSRPPLRLDQDQRQSYFDAGFLAAPGATPPEMLARIRAKSDEFLERSRAVTASNDVFDLGPNHSAARPHVRRLRRPVDQDPFFWEVATADFMTEIAADLVGPDVKFHSCKLNYKWPGAGELVKWHQDICAWPHTNYSPVTLGIYLDDVTDRSIGPLACIPGSHEGELYSHYGPGTGAERRWTGHMSDVAAVAAGAERAVDLTGPAGTVIAINCRTVHGSLDNLTDRVRPLLLYVYSSADAFPWTAAPTPTSRTGEIVRGRPAEYPHMDPRLCPAPPDWSRQGYGSIFAAQAAAD